MRKECFFEISTYLSYLNCNDGIINTVLRPCEEETARAFVGSCLLQKVYWKEEGGTNALLPRTATH